MTPVAGAVAVLLVAAAGALLPAPRPIPALNRVRGGGEPESAMRRYRWLLGVLAACGGYAFGGPVLGPPAAVAAGSVTWVLAGRSEPAAERREREAARRDLPHVVHLLGVVLGSGVSVQEALIDVSRALPGPAGDHLRRAASRISLGVAPESVWAEVSAVPGLAPLGRALERAATSGSGVADVVQRLGDDLARDARHGVEDRARRVGVRAALPLGLCLLPAFLLVGIVPVVASALAAIRW
jgi:Flp pilus assembly protein TadB